ncbi:MAG: Sperm-specific protein Don juan [Planctomycetota bacterium]|nr:MAG: Sperm-specific protein Don juan [Planctomycetota bacterium]
MKMYSRRFVAALALAVMQAGVVPAQDETKTEPVVPTKPSRSELRDKQLDVSLEARDIERILSKLKRASELSKTRITEAAKTAESASTALDKGDSKGARGDAQQAAEMFQEIIKQLEALLVEETPQRVAAARDLAKQLAKLEREFAQQFPGVLNPAQAEGTAETKVDPKSQTKPKNKNQGSSSGGQPKKMEKKDGGKDSDPKPEPRDGQGADGKKKEPAGDDAKDPTKGDGGDAKDKNEKTGPKNADGKSPPEKTEKKKDGEGGTDPKSEPNDGQGTGGKKQEKDGDDVKDPMQGGGGEGDEKDKNERETGSSGSRKDKPLTEAEKREALARRAEQLAKTGETLKDVLQAISQSNDPADKEAVAKLEAILKETDLLKAIEAMPKEADQIRSDKLDDARLASLDLADRLEITAQRLDAAYRAIVAPQAEELRKLEQALADLRDKLENLETQAQVAAWHREAQDLLDRAEKLGISDKVREDLLEQMKKAGLGVNGARNRFNWGMVNDHYAAPDGYAVNLIRVQEEVQARIQNLLLGDISAATDEATPPKYQDLVERYYQVLSQSGKSQISNPKSQSTPKPELKKK